MKIRTLAVVSALFLLLAVQPDCYAEQRIIVLTDGSQIQGVGAIQSSLINDSCMLADILKLQNDPICRPS
ncbi:MAG: hypothetical protein CMQ21_12050 [Gammaproteobacteria bacterium]|nr:hypothetical protein [Gammaproteobacteria bacterium]